MLHAPSEPAHEQSLPHAGLGAPINIPVAPTAELLRHAAAAFRSAQWSVAEATYRRVLEAEPSNFHARNGLATTLAAIGRGADAVASFRAILAEYPNDPLTLNNFGITLAAERRIREAELAFRRALRWRPDLADAHHARGMLLLMSGRFSEGFEELEWRWRTPGMRSQLRGWAVPQWRGEALGNRTLLLHAEQGLGDTLQFCRYASLIKGGPVLLEVPAPLARLMSSLDGVAGVLVRGQALPPIDLHCPLLSLPRAFGTTLESIPSETPYLRANAAEVEGWRARLPQFAGLKVGLVWAGRRDLGRTETDARRSLSLQTLAPLGDVPGVSFVSLQKGVEAAQAGSPPAGMELRNHSEELTDFAATAALIECLDLVITVDTAVVHLAGALSKPVWLLNRFDADWRWLLRRDDSPWYPSLWQFRQEATGDWATVIARVRRALRTVAAAHALERAEILERAYAEFQSARLLEAKALYSLALSRDMHDAEAWYMRSRVAHQGGRLEEAVAVVRRAIALDATQPSYSLHLGGLLTDLDRRRKVEAFFNIEEATA